MNFGEVQLEVGALTRRGVDKADLIKSKINAACRMIVCSGKFYPDLYEETYSGAGLTADSFVQSLVLPDRTRNVEYIQDPARPEAHILLQDVQYALRNSTVQDIGYLAGANIQLRLAVIPTTINLGVYRLPEILVNDIDSNWVLETMPEVVIDYASAWVLTMLGEKEISAAILRFAGQTMATLVQDRLGSYYGRI